MSHQSLNKAMWLSAVVLAGTFSTYLQAQPTPAAEGLPPYEDVVNFCQQFGGILEPEAPVDEVFVGTFDALTSEFTWAVGAKLRNLPPPYVPPWAQPGPWLEDYIRLQSLFDQLDIRSIPINLYRPVLSRPPRVPMVRRRVDRAAFRDIRFEDLLPAAPTGEAPSGKAYFVRAVGGQLLLRFRVVNRPPNVPFRVRVYIPFLLGGGSMESSEVMGTPGDESAYVLIPPVGYVNFSVNVGPNEFEDAVGFARPPALGCFTLDALPVSYVYEPPGSNSAQSYTVANQVGTTIRDFVAENGTTTDPDHVSFFTEAKQLADALKGVGSLVALVYPQVGGAMQGAGSALTALFGSVTENTTVSHKVTEDHFLLLQETSIDSLTTSLHLGPGRGDMIKMLINPTFAWLAAQDEETGRVYLSVALLGYETVGRTSAQDLRVATPPFTDALIPADTRRTLLELDPLTAESQAVHPPSDDRNPAPNRFVRAGGDIAHVGGIWTFTQIQTLQETYSRTEVVVKSTTRTEEGGFLSFLPGAAVTGSKTLKTTIGSGTAYSETSTASASITLDTALGEGLLLRPYFDTLYGTFALVPLPSTGPAITGRVTLPGGRGAGRRDVVLIAGLRRIVTRTDSSGRYRIPAGALEPGRYAVVVGNERQMFEYSRAPTTVNVRLRQP